MMLKFLKYSMQYENLKFINLKTDVNVLYIYKKQS